MKKDISILLLGLVLLSPALGYQAALSAQTPKNIAFTNGRWFNGESFVSKTMYCTNGYFASKRPSNIDTAINLNGWYIVPPFAEAHNHNINGGNPRNQMAIARYLKDGVFYVKLPGNFFLSAEECESLGLNTPYGVDVSLSQGAGFTSTGGHPYKLAEEVWFKFGFAKGPVDSLNGRRFFTIDKEEEIEQKWEGALKQHPDFIKTILWHSDEYQKRKGNKEFYGKSGLNPSWLSQIVAKAHSHGLRVSTHVNNAYDFHVAVLAGVDEIAHLPWNGLEPVEASDARLAAKKGIVVVTTCRILSVLEPPEAVPNATRAQSLKIQSTNLKLLKDNGVTIAIGSDIPQDSSLDEFEYLSALRIFDNLNMLKMWTEATARTIFPKRKIGSLEEGFEASFLALEENPLSDIGNVRKIKLRFKQGNLLTLKP